MEKYFDLPACSAAAGHNWSRKHQKTSLVAGCTTGRAAPCLAAQRAKLSKLLCFFYFFSFQSLNLPVLGFPFQHVGRKKGGWEGEKEKTT
jgi:hypothetical protein